MSEQKKQRKKLNIIDLIIILLLLAAVVFLVSRGIRSYRAAQILEVEKNDQIQNACRMPEDFQPNLRVELVYKNVERTEAERITKAEYLRLYNSYVLLDAYITEMRLQPSVLRSVDRDGKEVCAESASLVDIRFTVDAQVDLSNPDSVIDGNFNPLIGSQELRIGKQYILKTMEIEIAVLVTDMEILYEAA